MDGGTISDRVIWGILNHIGGTGIVPALNLECWQEGEAKRGKGREWGGKEMERERDPPKGLCACWGIGNKDERKKDEKEERERGEGRGREILWRLAKEDGGRNWLIETGVEAPVLHFLWYIG